MSRIHRFTPDELEGDRRAAYDSITGGPRARGPQHFALTAADGSLNGPFNAMLLSPRLGLALQSLGAAVRYETALSPRVREMAILIVAAHWDSAFERMAHEAVGAAAGLSESEMSAIRSGGAPDLGDAVERASVDFARAIVRGDASDAQWDAARRVLDEVALFELATLVGYYAALALQLRVFRVGA
ncbi:carboxymuconolactone decarboxylase family protein [Salinibacterium sp. SYSU T00001]|uniref:carboxymuconolactone decarboxylase family protein n=1 Tax=Homoserinimonas sedimenticola TaxID=2986805 RepID=UPI002235D031|nr:carboxymuconolactone decarboxylase family protein [Salinibacterium sedimenticola]MCW4386240.1 carboxymuconolactone decarboxylase family protein [Salinibacterium sedimenticola]